MEYRPDVRVEYDHDVEDTGNVHMEDVHVNEARRSAPPKRLVLSEIMNRRIFFNLFRYLRMEDLSHLSSTCRRLNYFVQEYVQELQLIVNDEYGVQNLVHLEENNVVLREMNPDLFLYPNPPFQLVTKLSLNFSGDICGKINLIALPRLTHLKIRGPNIKLSANRLKTVIDLDIDDPDCCERQVFPNLKHFHLEFDVEEISQIYNSTEAKALEFIFIKSLDILTSKKKIESVKFTLSLFMEILVFEKFVDSLDTFLQDYEELNDEGKIEVLLKRNTDYLEQKWYEEERVEEKQLQLGIGLERRFEFAFERLDDTLPRRHYNFKIGYESLGNARVY